MIVPRHKTRRPIPILIDRNCTDSFLFKLGSADGHQDDRVEQDVYGRRTLEARKEKCSSGHLLLLRMQPLLQPAARNYRVITGPIRAGLDPACHTEPGPVLNFFLSDPRSSLCGIPSLRLHFSPPRPRTNSEASHLQEDCKPPLEVNSFCSSTLQKMGKDKETEERSREVPPPPAPALILCGKDFGLIVVDQAWG